MPSNILQAMQTWDVIDWASKPDGDTALEFDLLCECGNEALCPTLRSVNVIARLGMGFVCDQTPPVGFMPDQIRCRRCGKLYQRS